MKSRAGFVSNSSSASYLLAFPVEPTSPGDIKQILFPNISRKKVMRGSTNRGKFKITVDQLVGFIYGQTCKHEYGEYDPEYPIGMMKLLWFISEDGDMEINDCSEFWIKKNKETTACSKKCPKFGRCEQQIGISDGQRKAVRWEKDLVRVQDAFNRMKAFSSDTLGYYYLYLDCGCQTSIGAYINENAEEIFKNINYVALGDL